MYHLFDRHDYFARLIKACQQANSKDKITLATMEFRPDQPVIGDIVDAMCQAAQQGADVTFMVDAYSLMLKDMLVPGPLFFLKRDPKAGYGTFKPVVSAIHKLREAGVNCYVINKPSRPFKNPFGGRSHIKYALINDQVFIGGCNLSNPEYVDVMVQTTNQRLAEYLRDFTADVIACKSVRRALARKDRSFSIDPHTELLIDAGVKYQSLIYERAFSLINNAAHRVYMTCQYFPNNYTPRALAKAYRRGVGVHLAYNHPGHHRAPIRAIQKRTVYLKKKWMPDSVFENELHRNKDYLHAKILLSEKEAIVGSHNFVKMGVNLGTAEIALHSTAPEFIASARKWVQAL